MLALVDHHLAHLTPQAGRSSVPVAVVHIGHVRMDMMQRLVAMAVAVRALGHRLVPVVVMPIVVPMRVFVLQRLVFVLVAVRLGQVQQRHRPASARCPAAIQPLAERSPSSRASAAPMKGAKAKTEPVRAAPKARCASR